MNIGRPLSEQNHSGNYFCHGLTEHPTAAIKKDVTYFDSQCRELLNSSLWGSIVVGIYGTLHILDQEAESWGQNQKWISLSMPLTSAHDPLVLA